MTLADRKMRILVARKLDNYRVVTLKESICDSLGELPCNIPTVDNGKDDKNTIKSNVFICKSMLFVVECFIISTYTKIVVL